MLQAEILTPKQLHLPSPVMARAHCTVFSLLLSSNNPITKRTHPLIVVSSIPTPNPSRVRLRRKNHLRPKILKTLTKSHPPIVPLLPRESPLSPPETPEENNLRVEAPTDGDNYDGIAAAAGSGELAELQVSETTGTFEEYSGVVGKLSVRSILKYGAFFVGAFMLQTVFAVWVLLDEDSKQKGENLDINVRGKRSVLFDGSESAVRVSNASGVVYVEDQLEMEKKIEEIKLMAREARRNEEVKKEEEIEDSESDDESEVSGHRLGIEKEIGERLLKLQDRENSDKDKTALLNVINNLGRSVKSSGVVAGDNKNVNNGNGGLKFKKKFKYRSPSTKPTKTPKGFSGIRNFKASDAESRDSASKGIDTAQENGSSAADHGQTLYLDKQVNQQDFETQESCSRLSLEDGGKLVHEEAKTILDCGKNVEEVMARPNVEFGTGAKSDETSKGNEL